MQKRVGLARAVVANPEILFFDEPTTGLDPITADVINDLIVAQVRRLGCTAVSITHDMASARKIADEIAMLHAAGSSGAATPPTSTPAATPTWTSSSTAAPKGP
jgi:phospholipid/cholesterol/gamma-HCH transport system ATP-binding protein